MCPSVCVPLQQDSEIQGRVQLGLPIALPVLSSEGDAASVLVRAGHSAKVPGGRKETVGQNVTVSSTPAPQVYKLHEGIWLFLCEGGSSWRGGAGDQKGPFPWWDQGACCLGPWELLAPGLPLPGTRRIRAVCGQTLPVVSKTSPGDHQGGSRGWRGFEGSCPCWAEIRGMGRAPSSLNSRQEAEGRVGAFLQGTWLVHSPQKPTFPVAWMGPCAPPFLASRVRASSFWRPPFPFSEGS